VTTEPKTPRKYLLATWLSAGNLLIVLLALVLMALASSIAVGRFAERQGLARSELAVSSAREFLHRLGESNLSAARTLADRPTLARLLDDPASPGLGLYLGNYCRDVHATACIISNGPAMTASHGEVDNWPEIAAARAEQGERFLLAPQSLRPPIVGAAADVPAHAGLQVVVLQQLSGEVLREAGRQSGAALRLLNIRSYHAPPADPLTPLHGAALANGEHAVARVAGLESYAASAVIVNTSGEPVALLDAQLPTAEFDRSAASYRNGVILISLAVAVLLGVIGILYGLWLSAPVTRLADMARQIGLGDFSPAVPAAMPREFDTLARAMDDMRHNLIGLTDSLRRQEGEARAVLAGVVEGVFVTDAERRIVYANPQFSRTAPGAGGNPIGRFCGDVLYPHTAPEERPCDRDCPILAARQHGVARLAEQLPLGDGTVRPAIVVSSKPTAGRQVQLLRDETDLEAARRARDSVLGNISHEFRTPLAAQLASIEMLRTGLTTLTPAQQGELLSNVERGVLRLMRLIDNLLESVRIESGQLALRQQQVDLEATVHEAVELLRPLLQQGSQDIAVDFSALPQPVVPGDAQRLQQVFVNLLSNAIKFAPQGSTIHVGARSRGSVVEAWVEDGGPGPPAGDSRAIFERFRRGDNCEPDAPGLGLGLWIARSIVERHAGSIRAERTAESRTRFVITLPLESGREDTAG
jgi:signal transduction histidine kinase